RVHPQQRRLGALARALLGHAAEHLAQRRDRAHGGARLGGRDPRAQPAPLRAQRPWIDQVTWTRAGEPGVYRRVSEVIDAWFDSGSMPFAQWGWPHKNQGEFEQNFPADFISEAIDQTRGWFNSLLWIS